MIAFALAAATAAAAAMSPCDACRMVVWQLNVSLLDDFISKGPAHESCTAESEASRIRMEVATQAEEAVESMCLFQAARADAMRHTACENLVQDHGDDVTKWMTTWALDGDSMAKWAKLADRSAFATVQLCAHALGLCSDDVVAWKNDDNPVDDESRLSTDDQPRSSQAHDDGTLGADGKPGVASFPLPDISDGRVVPVTSAHLASVAIGFLTKEGERPNSEGRDILLYYYFERKDYDDWKHDHCRSIAHWDDKLRGTMQPLRRDLAEDNGEVHDTFYPNYQELARLLKGQRSLVLARVDARCNDFAHPMNGFDVPTLALHPAGDKALRASTVTMAGGGSGFMRSVLMKGGLSIDDLIRFLLSQKITEASKASLRTILKTHGAESNYIRRPHTKNYYESRARGPLAPKQLFHESPPPPPPRSKGKKKKKKGKGKKGEPKVSASLEWK